MTELSPVSHSMREEDDDADLNSVGVALPNIECKLVDPETGEMDAHGPYEGFEATLRAEELRRNFDGDGLPDVVVRVSRLHLPAKVPAQAW